MNWKVSGYIMGNLLKHREVDNFYELAKSPYSSFGYKMIKYGEKNARSLVRGVIVVDEDSDGEVNVKELTKLRLKSQNPG
jgi:hypothetical protein